MSSLSVQLYCIVDSSLKESVACCNDSVTVVYTDDVVASMRSILAEPIDVNVELRYIVGIITTEKYTVISNSFSKNNLKNTYIGYVCIGNSTDDIYSNEIIAYYAHGITQSEFNFIVNKARSIADQRYTLKKFHMEFVNQIEDTQRDFEALINIGKALTIEKDPDKLLRLILRISKTITGADAGSIYIVEEIDGKKILRFKHSHTFSKQLPYEEFTIPMDKNSIAGYVAITQQVLNIPDVYALGPDDPVSFNSSFDKAHNYRSKSMLVVPMINHFNQTIGVIQLINSKEDITGHSDGNEAYTIKLETEEDFATKVVPFQKRYESLMEAVASQAAIAIENNRLIRQIQYQFEEFVKASVTAIESRDVATSGHSFRVADLCLKIARAINADTSAAFAHVTFTETELKELEYAALLHDFGKVYIDPAIFLKSQKLYPYDLENIELKLEYLYRYQQLKYLMQIYNVLSTQGNIEGKETIQKIENERDEILHKIIAAREKIKELNNPMVQEADIEKEVMALQQMLLQLECYDINNQPMEILSEYYIKNLSIKRGSLNEDERREIESHVIHTYNFVSKIPWPPEYARIPEIALTHHEKLDGSGYPYGLKGEQIPLQARIMAIADIYDALMATDRPYKPQVSLEQALRILQDEADRNKLDKNIVALFINNKIYLQFDRNAYRLKCS